MVAANIFRPGPPPPPCPIPGGEDVAAGIASGGEDGDEESYMDPAWMHLQTIYEFFLRFIVSGEVKAKTAKRWVDASFCGRLIEQFDAEDARERDYLKTILHRIYGKFMTHRGFIRKTIANVFFRFVYETEHHHGIGELLEILGSVINGFALPLKPEHLQFLDKAIIPLHRPHSVGRYYQQLCYCVSQYIEKDPNTIVSIIMGILRSWPWMSSSKQIVFLNELEEILQLAQPQTLRPVMKPLFVVLAKCVGSEHFQVAERSLFLWNNEKLMKEGVLARVHVQTALPILFSALQKQGSGHWNTTVENLARVVLTHYQSADPALFDRCSVAAASEPAEKAMADAQRTLKWSLVSDIARAVGGGSPGSAARPLRPA
jgi:serine/threonine-protein phosphatase 2A regulatory subunit B'